MKLTTSKTVFLILMASYLVSAATVVSAEVYKTVDENGNVVFTDRPPEDGTKPIDLPPLSVIETPEYQVAPKTDEIDSSAQDASEMSLPKLRQYYADFALISPRAEESIWRPDIVITAAWKTQKPLQKGMTINIYVDDKLYQTTTEQIVPLGALDRGEHKVTATLNDAMKRSIATASPIVFYVRQPMNYPSRPTDRN